MASIDVSADYKKIQSEVESADAYKDLKEQYREVISRKGDSFEKKSDSTSKQSSSLSGSTKAYQKKVKSQFDHLLDVNNVTGKKSLSYVKKKFIQVINTIEPEILTIIYEEILALIGCDQQLGYVPNTPVYIKVSSIDLTGLLKIDPTSQVGKLLYEKSSVVIQNNPFPLNKELYSVTQSTNPYSVDNSQFYVGTSGQNLFDIQFLEINPTTGIGGGWFKVTPKARFDVNNNPSNLVGQFVQDYYSTIKLFDGHNLYSWLMNFLTGALSIKLGDSDVQIKDKSWFSIMIQRILGLCFDNRSEIDVSGNAKISPSDGIDQSFFELDSIDLREIDQKINNIKKGVITFVECDNVDIPINTEGILNELDKLRYVKDNDFNSVANSLTANIVDPNSPNKNLPNLEVFDKEFIKLLITGLVSAILSPKVLLPIFTMMKSVGQSIDDNADTFEKFFKQFKTFAINVISRISAIFVKTLFEIIKRDIKQLMLSVITDIAREKKDKLSKMILKLAKILLTVAELYKLVTDWRKCKSVVDELLALLQIWQSEIKGFIPFPLLYTARLLDGYSDTRAFIGTIKELQKLGIPTGRMPDGSPNLSVLSVFSQLKASSEEEVLNGKIQTAIPPLTITPSGFTLPASSFGKKM